MSPDARVNFRTDPRLVERVDALATALHEDRTTTIVAALREFVDRQVADDGVRRSIANAYFADELTADQVRLLLGGREALAFRAMEERLDDGSLTGELADLVDRLADDLDLDDLK